MATNFISTFYELNNGLKVPIRIDTKTNTAFPGATGPADVDCSAQISRSRRTLGIHPRAVRLKKAGATATEKDLFSTIPVAVKATWEGLNIGGTVTGYSGYVIDDLIAEKLR